MPSARQRERSAARLLAWKAASPERRAARLLAWREAHPGQVASSMRTSAEPAWEIGKVFGCDDCGGPLEVDHELDTGAVLGIVCRSCNHKKG